MGCGVRGVVGGERGWGAWQGEGATGLRAAGVVEGCGGVIGMRADVLYLVREVCSDKNVVVTPQCGVKCKLPGEVCKTAGDQGVMRERQKGA